MQNPLIGQAIGALADGAPRRKALCNDPLSTKNSGGTQMRREHFLLLLGVIGAVAGAGAVAAPTGAGAPSYDLAAVEIGRRPVDRDFDVPRRPVKMLEFIGIKPGDKIIDVIPDRTEYFTHLFSSVVGQKGVVYDFMPDELGKMTKTPLPASGSRPDPLRPNVAVLVQPVNDLAPPEPVDEVWVWQRYHDLHNPVMGPADLAKFNAAVFKALKPGGVYVVLDHSAPAGSGLTLTSRTGRIDAAMVKAEVLAAGFTFVGEDNILRNPLDMRDVPASDPAILNRTDQFIYKFRKPK
jgi:predicted methyltransferase